MHENSGNCISDELSTNELSVSDTQCNFHNCMYIGVDTTRTYSMYISAFLSMYFFVLSNLNKDIKPFFYNKLLLLILSLSRLIFTGFKRPLTDSDLWALNKKNRASTIVPPFIKKWQEAESATRY